jgi:hypothetical protein
VLGAPDILAPGSAARAAEEIGASGLRVLLAEGRCRSPTRGTRHRDPAALVILEQWPDARHPGVLRRAARAGKVIPGDNARSVGAVTTLLGVVGGNDPIDADLSQVDPTTPTQAGQPAALPVVGNHHDRMRTCQASSTPWQHTVRTGHPDRNAMVLALRAVDTRSR